MKRKPWRVVLLVVAGMSVVIGLWAERDSTGDTDGVRRVAALQKTIAAEGLCWQAGETSMSRLSENSMVRLERPLALRDSSVSTPSMPLTASSSNWVTRLSTTAAEAPG